MEYERIFQELSRVIECDGRLIIIDKKLDDYDHEYVINVLSKFFKVINAMLEGEKFQLILAPK